MNDNASEIIDSAIREAVSASEQPDRLADALINLFDDMAKNNQPEVTFGDRIEAVLNMITVEDDQ